MPFPSKPLGRLDSRHCSGGCSGLQSRLEVYVLLATKEESTAPAKCTLTFSSRAAEFS